jgi:IclR family pca regulon transcriptional regulator
MLEGKLPKRDFAQTLARGLNCLEVLADASKALSCSEVAAAMKVSRAAARRLLLTLQYLGYTLEERGVYASSPKVLALGRGVLASGGLWNSVAPEVVGLADRFNEPCSISVLEGLDILFVCRDATRRIFSTRLGVGDRLPAHCSASGKMLLSLLSDREIAARLKGANLRQQGPAAITDTGKLKASLREIRAAGFAMAIDEMEEGTHSIAVPIRERSGRAVAAMSLASHKSRRSPSDLKKSALTALREAVLRVEAIIRDFQDRNWTMF